MLTAYIKSRAIIPYDSIEYIEEHGDSQAIVHMMDSKKEYILMPSEVNEFLDGYKAYLELKEVMMGIVSDYNPDDIKIKPTKKNIEKMK